MRAHYNQMVLDTEKRVEHSLQIQNRNLDSTFYGGFPQPNGVYQPKFAIYRVASMVSAYCNRDTKFYQNEKVLDRILLGLDYVDRVQHENGLFDLVSCNFFSAPDTAFCLKKIIPHLQFLQAKNNLSDGERVIESRIERIIHSGARGLLEGGFHTPNHRWAIASVLAMCAKLFQENDLKNAAFDYLNEGIDCNEDGEYAEKSAGNYNRISNDAMIMLAEALNDPGYEQHAIRNLKMMLTYWEPDDSIFTANSTRQDNGRLLFPKDYYFEYLSLGIRYNIPEFIAMANHIFDTVYEQRLSSPDLLIMYMNHPEYINFESELNGVPTHYRNFCQESGIARVRRGKYTYTVMRDKSNFLYVHNGSIKLAMKLGGSFCEHRAFKAESMRLDAKGAFHLHQTMRGWYYLPFEEKPDTSDWWKMDNSSRNKKMGPDMDIDVVIWETDDGIDVDIQTSGVEGAPWRVELAFNGIERLSNEHMTMPITGDETLVLKDDYFEVSNATSSMRVGPAFGLHYFTEGKENSEAKTPGAATVYLTDYTAFHHTISIRP